MNQQRQLAAIMFTDIVGYTALMGENEEQAYELLNKNRQLQKPLIEKYGGRWIKELGDGVMASFPTVTDAVSCAIDIQKGCQALKAFRLRIGIHLGELIFENNDVFGDGVNIASRIQAVAPPGGIWISEAVRQNISNKKHFDTVFAKTLFLKNVKQPVKVFLVRAEGLESPSKQGMKIKLHRRSLLYKLLPVLAGVVLIIAGYLLYTKAGNTGEADLVKQEIQREKSIAVLPFVNMSRDPEHEYFSDGLSEELLNLLAKIPELKVIGRTSSFAFKGKNEDLREIGKTLGVAHLLEGSVRKDGNKIRVSAKLISADDGSELWGETYNRDLKSIFDLQDEIAEAVVQQLRIQLLDLNTIQSAGTKNVEAHNLVLQANYYFDKLDKENVARSVQLYEQALAIDSTDARAWGKLANAYSRQAWQNYIDRNTGRAKAKEAATKAIRLNKNLALGYLELGDLQLYHEFDWKGAEENYLKAISLEPDNPDILYGLGGSLYFATGRWEDAIRLMNKSIELEPLKPLYYLNMGNILTHAGRQAEALPSFIKALDLNPSFQRAHFYMGRNYLLLGKPDLAIKEIEAENMEVFKKLGLALYHFSNGEKKEADSMLNEFTTRFSNDWPYLMAELHAFRGEKDKAFYWLEISRQKSDGWLVFLKGDPLLKNLLNDPRYDSFLSKMNLAEYP